MQESLETSRYWPLPAETMPTWQRRASLGMLVALAATFNIAFNHDGPSFLPSATFDWSQSQFGSLFAQTSILAIWSAWRQQPITVRGPWALGMAAFIGLSSGWGVTRNSVSNDASAIDITSLAVLVFLAQTLALLLLRRLWRWRLCVSNDDANSAAARFTLRQVLLWTTAFAGLLALLHSIWRPRQANLTDALEAAAGIAIAAPVERGE